MVTVLHDSREGVLPQQLLPVTTLADTVHAQVRHLNVLGHSVEGNRLILRDGDVLGLARLLR